MGKCILSTQIPKNGYIISRWHIGTVRKWLNVYYLQKLLKIGKPPMAILRQIAHSSSHPLLNPGGTPREI